MAKYTCINSKVYADTMGHSNAPACVHKRTCVYLPTHLRVFANTPACVLHLFSPHSATKMAILPTISFHLRSRFRSSLPLKCAQNIGKSIGMRGSLTPFEA